MGVRTGEQKKRTPKTTRADRTLRCSAYLEISDLYVKGGDMIRPSSRVQTGCQGGQGWRRNKDARDPGAANKL